MAKDSFLPDDYNKAEVPKEEKYLKFSEEGEYRFRFLSSPIIGVEAWKGGKPLRWRTFQEVPTNEVWDEYKGKPKPPKTFWAAVVWNYKYDKDENGKDIGKIQILNLTQVSIINPIKELIKDSEWGSPKEYDLKVKREDADITEYTVTPCIPKPLDPLIVGEYGMANIKLEALFDGKDPFAK